METVNDAKAWIMARTFPMEAPSIRKRELTVWLAAAGFTDILVRSLPWRGPDEACWEVLARVGSNNDCSTETAFKSCMDRLAADLGCWIYTGERCTIVWGDRVGAQFRLRPLD